MPETPEPNPPYYFPPDIAAVSTPPKRKEVKEIPAPAGESQLVIKEDGLFEESGADEQQSIIHFDPQAAVQPVKDNVAGVVDVYLKLREDAVQNAGIDLNNLTQAQVLGQEPITLPKPLPPADDEPSTIPFEDPNDPDKPPAA